jgi:hypothetical protein
MKFLQIDANRHLFVTVKSSVANIPGIALILKELGSFSRLKLCLVTETQGKNSINNSIQGVKKLSQCNIKDASAKLRLSKNFILHVGNTSGQ